MTSTLTNGTIQNGYIATFDPKVLGVGLWYDMLDRESFTLDGSNNVSQLSDKSGNGYHATQGTVLDRPPYDATGFNGRPSISFVEASTTYLSRNMAGTFISNPTLSGAVTLFFVFNNTVNPGTRLMFDSGAAINGNCLLVALISTLRRIRVQTATRDYYPTTSEWIVGQNTILSMIWNGSTLKSFSNGGFVQETAGVAQVGTDVRTNMSLGTGSIPGLYATFKFAELQIYPSAFTEENRKKAENYFRIKWGL